MKLQLQAGDEQTFSAQGTYIFLKYAESSLDVAVELRDGTRASYPLEKADQVRFDDDIIHITVKTVAAQTIEILSGFGQFISHTDVNGQKLTVEFEDPQQVLVQNQQVPVEIVSGGFDGVINNTPLNPVPITGAGGSLSVEVTNDNQSPVPITSGLDLSTFDKNDPATWGQIIAVFDIGNNQPEEKKIVSAYMSQSITIDSNSKMLLWNDSVSKLRFFWLDFLINITGTGKATLNIWLAGEYTSGSINSLTLSNLKGDSLPAGIASLGDFSASKKILLKKIEIEKNSKDVAVEPILIPFDINPPPRDFWPAFFIELVTDAGDTVNTKEFRVLIQYE